MACGNRPNYETLPSRDWQSQCAFNIAEMSRQLQAAGRLTAEVTARLAKCSGCSGCIPKGYCTRLVQDLTLQDCQKRWDAYSDVLTSGNCPGFTDPSFSRNYKKETTMADATTTPDQATNKGDAPTVRGLYWAAITFPSPNQPTPTLSGLTPVRADCLQRNPGSRRSEPRPALPGDGSDATAQP